MARSVPWKRTVSDAVSWRQDQSQSAIIYILRETGPTGFLLKEEGETKKYKVFLGDPHSCTCQVFTKEKDLCKHICWVLLKKFRIPRENPLSFQLGLVEREINEILRGINKRETQRPSRRAVELAKKGTSDKNASLSGDGREALPQKDITEDDVCPICQDELLEKREPVTYCRYGCGKSTHIKCMKVWAEHQKSTGETVIRCPLCREDFGQLEDLQAEYRTAALQKTRTERRDDIHMGISCKGCNQSPVSGKCYRCSQCFDISLCHECFSNNFHPEHSFQFRQKPTQRWRPAKRGSGTALPQAVVDDLLSRDISDEDYDLLLQLDNDAANKPSSIPENVIKSFPTETVRQGSAMLTPGTQCRVCLRGYDIGQVVRRLPCRHKYHVTCIDQWLLHEHPTCPIDGMVVWNPITAETRQRKQRPHSLDRDATSTNQTVLEIPGIGVSVRHCSLDRGTVRHGGGHRQIVERAPEGDHLQGLASTFQLTGSGISSNVLEQTTRNSSAENTRTHQSSSRRGSNTRPSVKQPGRISNHPRTVASDETHVGNSLAVTGANGLAVHSSHMVENPGRTEGNMGHRRPDRNHIGSNQRHSHVDHGVSNQRTSNNAHNEMAHRTAIDRTEGSISTRMEGLSVGSGAQMISSARTGGVSSTVAGPGWRPPPSTLANGRSHISSIPLLREEAAMTPVGNRHQQINSSSPVSRRKPPIPDGGSPGLGRGAGERGRRSARSEGQQRRGSRSSSTGRARSRERTQPEPPRNHEPLENMFLGSPTGNLVISQTTPGSPSNRGHRSNHPRQRNKPVTQSGSSYGAEGASTMDIALTGNRLR